MVIITDYDIKQLYLEYDSKLEISLNISSLVNHTHFCDDGNGLYGATEAPGRGEERLWPAAGSFYLTQKLKQFRPNGNKAYS